MIIWGIIVVGIFSIIIGAEVAWFMSIQNESGKILYCIFAYMLIISILYLINIEIAIYSYLVIITTNIIFLYIITLDKKKKEKKCN
jgi:ABC-type uncharacterized transport system permease subunit